MALITLEDCDALDRRIASALGWKTKAEQSAEFADPHEWSKEVEEDNKRNNPRQLKRVRN